MKKHKLILLVILLVFLMTSIFSMVLAYKVISNFNTNDIYNLTQFKDDIELSLIIMVANVIGNIFLFSYLWKNKIIDSMLNIEKKDKNVA